METVSRTQCSAKRCSAEPGPSQRPESDTVPALRSGMKNAAARPGHGFHLKDTAGPCDNPAYSTVTDLARLRGWSTSVPITTAV